MKIRKFSGPQNDGYVFWCPGCDEVHQFQVPPWTFDGDMERPTFGPSLLHPSKPIRCHLVLRAGRIEFCGDCAHPLAGQTVDLPDLPDEILAWRD